MVVPASRRGVALVAGFAGAWVLAFTFDPGDTGLFCPLRRATGWWCPLCGASRATHALARGRLVDALRLNALWVGAVVVLAAVVVATACLGVRRRRSGRVAGLAWILAASIVGFTLLRNLPGVPLRG